MISADDMAQYRDLFLSEAAEHVASMNRGLLALEKNPADRRALDEVFRAAHTLKSMAATMDYEKTAALCHATEDVLDAIKAAKVGPQASADALFASVDTIESSLQAIAEGKGERDTEDLVHRLRALLTSDEPAETPPPQAASPLEPEKIRAIEVKVERLDVLMNLAEELLVNRLRLQRCGEILQDSQLSAAVDALDRLVTDLQYNVMQARMVPIGFIFNRFPRMVRDLAKQQDKEIDLQMEGGGIELDRTVTEGIGEALVHLLRNAIDHGVEPPDVRQEAGRSPKATIRLTAKRTRGLAQIEVADDGAGLDLDAIRSAAATRGLVPQAASAEEVTDALFSGVSTARDVTQVSGRGLGLSIAKTKIESLGGSIRVASKPRQGTTFTIEIPLTLAIINALFVEVGGRSYAVPLANIERLVLVDADEVKGMMGYEAVVLSGEELPVTRLDVLFGVPRLPQPRQPILITRRGENRLGLAVDAFGRTQEIVVKPLNRMLKESRYFAGSTIVGSGEAVLILDVNNLALSKRTREAPGPDGRAQDLAVLAGAKEPDRYDSET